MANIRDIAKKSGFSIATVSKVLSNDRSFSVKQETIEQIKQVALDLGYVHKSRKTPFKMGVIVPLSFEYYSDPFFGDILKSIEHHAHINNLEMSVVLRGSEILKNAQTTIEQLTNVDGLIIMESLNSAELKFLNSIVKNIVTIDFVTNKFTSVGFNHALSNGELMRHLIDYGYKKIAYIGGSDKRYPMKSQIKFMTYREGLLNSELEYNEDYVKDCHWDVNLCAQQVKELLEMKQRPDAIYLASDALASVALGVIYSMNLKCPDDIGIVGFNDIPTAKHFVPPLTTIAIPTARIGDEAVHQLLRQIKKKSNEIFEINVPFEIKIRESTQRQDSL